MKKNNILIFYVLAFLQGLVFYSSVCTLYRTDCGITLTQMGLIDGVLCICVILFEVPWGLICDRIGYRKTIVISNGFFFLSKLAFYKATTFWGLHLLVYRDVILHFCILAFQKKKPLEHLEE